MVKGRWVAKVERLMAKHQRLLADLERLVTSDKVTVVERQFPRRAKDWRLI
jgi:hypothetical protein